MRVSFSSEQYLESTEAQAWFLSGGWEAEFFIFCMSWLGLQL